MVNPKLSRGPKYSGGVPTLRMLNRGPPVRPNVPSGAPAHFGPMRNSPPMVTIQSGAAGTLAACAAAGVGAGKSLAKPVVGATAAPITAPTTTTLAADQPLECQTLVMCCAGPPLCPSGLP